MRRTRKLFRFASLFAAALALPAGRGIAGDPPHLNGYARTLSGEHIGYHSFHPYAEAALLTRCLDGKGGISWETAPIPAGYAGEKATFTWIAGHSSGTLGADATFQLDINGKRWGSFTNLKGKPAWKWVRDAADGSSLSFDAKWEDNVHDLFGYMSLTLPVAQVQKGKPLVLSITGDSTGRRDWFMTFKYELKESVTVEAQPALLRTPKGERQLIEVGIDHIRPGGHVEITATGGEIARADLPLGYSVIRIAIPEVKREEMAAVTIAIEGEPTLQREVPVRPVVQREFWILPHSHNDIGYSDLQADVEKKQIQNLRDAVALFRKTASYPAEARFRWNTEILWAVDRFFATGSAKERNEFIRAVKEGGIGLNGLYANQLTGICRPEELIRLTDFARTLRSRYGVTINDAMITDIPGATWAAVPALAQGGIRYFSSGPNYFATMPDGGDRVGYFNRTWGDRPFYWVSPSGNEKILMWVAGKGYSWFHGWMLGKMGGTTGPHLFRYLRELDARGYPYDMVQLRYTIMGDNGPTDPGLPDFVKEWNERYVSPRLVIATASRMFEEFERRWGAMLPAYRGEITPYWEDGAVSTLRELGMVRRASERLVQAEAAATLTGAPRLPKRDLEAAWRNVHLFDEHTWGAWNSVSEPESPFAVAQLDVKLGYAKDADAESRRLLERALAGRKGGDAFEVLNTTSWPRTELVLLSPEARGKGERIVDSDGMEIPSQLLSTGELAFVARNVPPLRARRYRVAPGPARPRGSVTVAAGEMRSDAISLAVDGKTGAVRSLRGPHGFELVNTDSLPGLAQYLYVPGRDPAAAIRNRNARIAIREPGPLVGILRIESDAPGCRSLVQELWLADGIPHVGVRLLIDKDEVREKESVHIAFPVQAPGGIVRFDGGWGIVRPESDQLPGSCKDYFSAGRWADVSNQNQGLTWTLTESPLVEVGKMTDETPGPKGTRLWRTTVGEGTTLFSYIMNNYWHTNYTAGQSGPVEVRYALHPHGMFNPADAYRWGVEQNQPLLLRRVGAAGAERPTLFTISSPGVAVTSLKPTEDGKGLMVRLYAASGKPEDFSIAWGAFRPARVSISSPAEERGAAAPGRLALPAFGIMTLRCDR